VAERPLLNWKVGRSTRCLGLGQSVHLNRLGKKQITGIDLSPTAVTKTKLKKIKCQFIESMHYWRQRLSRGHAREQSQGGRQLDSPCWRRSLPQGAWVTWNACWCSADEYSRSACCKVPAACWLIFEHAKTGLNARGWVRKSWEQF